MFFKVGHLLQYVCRYAFVFLFFGGSVRFVGDVSSGLLIFDRAPRGGGRDKSRSCFFLLNARCPGRPSTTVSYGISNVFCLRMLLYIVFHTVFDASGPHSGSILGPFGAFSGPSWGYLGAILGSSIILRSYFQW